MPKLTEATILQFRVLYRVFLLRVVDLEILSDQADPTRLLGQLAALLAAVSLLFILPIISAGRFSREFAWTMQHFLIASTMLVVGLFSVLIQDSIFPDKRDVLILSPLPVRPRMIFIAKLAAIAVALGIAILSLNIFTGILWPLFFTSAPGGILNVLQSFAAWWLTLLLAGAFILSSILGMQRIAALLLPHRHFLRLSAILQIVIFCLLLSVYILEPSLESIPALTAPENQHLLACLPTYWFFGLFHQLNGATEPAFTPLARHAWKGLAIAVTAAVASHTFAWVHTLRKIVEQPDIVPTSRHSDRSPRLGAPLPTAIALFTLRTLLRSRQHRIILSFYLGTGFAIVLACLRPAFSHPNSATGTPPPSGQPLLIASLLMISITIAALRILVSMPIALRANWIFRLTEIASPSAYLRSTHPAFSLLTLPPVLAVFAATFLVLWPSKQAAAHLLILALFGSTLISLSLYRFRKIPFTCSYLPGKGNIQFFFWASILVFLPLTNAAARLEWQSLQKPSTAITALAFVLSIAILTRWRTLASTKQTKELRFDEQPQPELITLKIPSEARSPIQSPHDTHTPHETLI